MERYVRKAGCETIELDREWIILNTDAFMVSRLNEVGGLCWSVLQEAQTVETLAAAVQAEYGVSNEAVQQDIQSFLNELIDCGLIEYAGQ